MLPALYAVTLFVSAALLFAVQPMAGKDLLPLAGGTPAVWTTCLVFFQAALLLGYLYADRIAALSVGRQALVHLAVGGLGLAAAVFLRPDPAWIPDDRDYPTLGLAAYLAALVGVPFFALSATAPLLQRWFAHTGHRSARDPYFLYAASNAGSLIGLLAYPFAVEPALTLGEQAAWWAVGYGVWLGLVVACGSTAFVGWVKLGFASADPPAGSESKVDEQRAEGSSSIAVDAVGRWVGAAKRRLTHPTEELTPARLLRWVALAALPSSLLLSVTAHLTTDVAPVPLLWVVPLSLYLLTFIVAFGYWPDRARVLLGRVAPALLTFAAVALVSRASEPAILVGAVHLAAFFAAALLCHGELAADRPSHEYLTRFYLAISLGGVLGGLLNAVVAPVIFSHVGPAEYPLGIVLAALVRPRLRVGEWGRKEVGEWGSRGVGETHSDSSLPHSPTPPLPYWLDRRDVMWVVVFAAVTLALGLIVPRFVTIPTDVPDADKLIPRLIRGGLTAGLPAAFAFALVRNPVRFAACLAVLFLAGRIDPGEHGETLLTTRNFFGTLRVAESSDGRFVRLVHGTTLHGQQYRDRPGPPKPLMYYHPRGPVGRLFEKLPVERKRRVAVVGLGCGAMAAYAEPGQTWTFFEIDPAVVRIARDTRYFSFLSSCRADDCRVVTGDARRQLAKEPDGSYDLIALDAFSSDAIPVHLLTREAFALYARKLAPGGVLAFHLSNNFLDLPPMVARIGAANDPPFECWVDDDVLPSDEERADGKFPSTWAILYRVPVDLGAAAKDIRWQKVKPTPGPVWRDDFSNLLAVWKRGEE